MDKGKEFCQILLSVLFFLKRPPKKLVGQSLSAFVATTFQHVSACRRSHSLTETVYLALLSLFGLISSFHNTFSCIWFFFFSFFGGCQRFALSNFFIISQNRKARQAILMLFSFSFACFAEFFKVFTLTILIVRPYVQVKSNIDCRFRLRFQA